MKNNDNYQTILYKVKMAERNYCFGCKPIIMPSSEGGVIKQKPGYKNLKKLNKIS